VITSGSEDFKMKTLKVGIASLEEMKSRTIAIAKGKYKNSKGEPKIWFTSAESFAKILSEKNRALLELIAEEQPDSITELEALSGRKKSNLSRTLKTMATYGLIKLEQTERGTIAPRVNYSDIQLNISLSY